MLFCSEFIAGVVLYWGHCCCGFVVSSLGALLWYGFISGIVCRELIAGVVWRWIC